jgi:hypothetical protein
MVRMMVTTCPGDVMREAALDLTAGSTTKASPAPDGMPMGTAILILMELNMAAMALSATAPLGSMTMDHAMVTGALVENTSGTITVQEEALMSPMEIIVTRETATPITAQGVTATATIEGMTPGMVVCILQTAMVASGRAMTWISAVRVREVKLPKLRTLTKCL